MFAGKKKSGLREGDDGADEAPQGKARNPKPGPISNGIQGDENADMEDKMKKLEDYVLEHPDFMTGGSRFKVP